MKFHQLMCKLRLFSGRNKRISLLGSWVHCKIYFYFHILGLKPGQLLRMPFRVKKKLEILLSLRIWLWLFSVLTRSLSQALTFQIWVHNLSLSKKVMIIYQWCYLFNYEQGFLMRISLNKVSWKYSKILHLRGE